MEIGESILNRRAELIANSQSDPLFRGDDPSIRIHEVLAEEKFANGGSFDAWTQSYNVNVWDIARPAVASQLGYDHRTLTASESKDVDEILAELSSYAIKENRLFFFRYCVQSIVYSLNRSIRTEKWSARLITVMITGALLITFRGFLLLLIRSGFPASRSGICLILALLTTAAILWDDVKGMTYYIWAWIPGTVSPQLMPVIAVFYGAIIGASYLCFGCPSHSCNLTFARNHAAAVCAAYCLGLIVTVSLVEAPLDRYLMTVWPVMSSLSTGLLWVLSQRLITAIRAICTCR